MKIFRFGLFLALITILAGCGILFSYPDDNYRNDMESSITNDPVCFDHTAKINDGFDTLTCVTFTYYPATEGLLLRHTNTGFNCCPGELTSEVWTNRDTLFVQEFQEKAECKCICLYELDIDIPNVEKKKYVVHFVEEPVENREKLEFVMDLRTEATGSFCVTRKGYPWGN